MVKKCIALIVLITMFFCSCNSAETDAISNKITVSVPELNLDNQQLYYYTTGNFERGSMTDSCAVFMELSDELQAEINLVVKTEYHVFKLSLGTGENKPFNRGGLYAVDFDNDKIDEIVFFAEVTGNGYSIAQIYKVDNEGIVLFEDLNQRKDINFEFKSKKELSIFNDELSFEKTIDISKEFPYKFFDADGKYNGAMSINILPVNSVEINKDERLIRYKYPLKLTNYIGTIECGLFWSGYEGRFMLQSISLKDIDQSGEGTKPLGTYNRNQSGNGSVIELEILEN